MAKQISCQLTASAHLSEDTVAKFDLLSPIDASIPVFSSSHSHCFGMKPSEKVSLYSLKKQSPVNVDIYHINPHNATTHTESGAHVDVSAPSVSDLAPEKCFFGCVLVTIEAAAFQAAVKEQQKSSDKTRKQLQSKAALKRVWKNSDLAQLKGDFWEKGSAPHEEKTSEHSNTNESEHTLMFRVAGTNIKNINTHVWSGTNPPYFTSDAIDYINELAPHCNVLLMDLPSIDKEVNEKVSSHKKFFFFDRESSQCPTGHVKKMITESIFVPESVKDGYFLLNLQLSPIVNVDAVPTRVVLYPCITVHNEKSHASFSPFFLSMLQFFSPLGTEKCAVGFLIILVPTETKTCFLKSVHTMKQTFFE
ncbi:hypothetical protein RFI_13655 [Reticulomyxa filosa]|uniref:Uncharacterized protein n=1 Tax=Reticulomyxa filosa TaxID=46433 RepID=X6NDV0_RETFI|nr:hypothetical protein RFI_13655 [Reticulomyxa filosa]|eukprot:ETO23522.1 hypothetical protein RFI_13655 [Reticulomyxa filosa]